jgi:hypothetical protein
MADADEEIAALVIDNGSGMCKGMLMCGTRLLFDRWINRLIDCVID